MAGTITKCLGDVFQRGQTSPKKIHICYSPAGRSVLGETVPKVLSTASGATQTEGTVSPNTERPRPVNKIFIFFPTEI